MRLRRATTALVGCLAGAAALAGAGATSATGSQPVAGIGSVPVPAAAQALVVTHPSHVIGNGSPAGCTSAAVVRAVAAGGIITFDCGRRPLTIMMRATALVDKTSHLVVLDGGGLITLNGGGRRRILFSDTCAGSWSTPDCVNQPYPRIVVQHITLADGYAAAHQNTSCTANRPACWYGGVDGGGAIYVEGGQFKAVDARFVGNRCFAAGPDLGGGAIRVLAQYRNAPVYINGDSFSGGRCSNGGALSSISVQWDIFNSRFTDNHAIGWGANPAARGTPGGGSGGAIYMDGTDDNALIAGTMLRGNTAREGGGAVFDVVDSGWGTLTFRDSQLIGETSGRFQTAPGVYYQRDGRDLRPTMIRSTDG